MESFIVKGNDNQWTEALMSKKSGGPEDGGIVQIKINAQSNKLKRVRDSDKKVGMAKKTKRKPEKEKPEKKPKEKL
jgi:hypothetical protein